jgi:antitoxin component YwqK of YwqJK toxin-antitoxin module
MSIVNRTETKNQIGNDVFSFETKNDGTYYYKNGKLHRDGDLPAIENSDGTKKWYKNGLRHRDGNLPAIEYSNSTKEYYKHGRLHCDNGPAIIQFGYSKYYKNDQLHRDGDLPAIQYSDGTQEWYKEGLLHRDGNLPAIIKANGSKEYYQYGQLHRENGPAIENKNGHGEYYILGEKVQSIFLTNGQLNNLQEPSVAYMNGSKGYFSNGKLFKIMKINGDIEYYKDGKLHRDDDKPAIVQNSQHGTRAWYQNGLLHRHNGPARTFCDTEEFYFKGKQYQSLQELQKANNIKPEISENYCASMVSKVKECLLQSNSTQCANKLKRN